MAAQALVRDSTRPSWTRQNHRSRQRLWQSVSRPHHHLGGPGFRGPLR